MFFCPTCKNMYDISKDIVKPQQGKGIIDYDQFIINFNKNIDMANIINDTTFSIDEIYKASEYKKLSKSQKEILINKVDYLLPKDKKTFTKADNEMLAYFNCKNCSNTEPIAPGTKIYTLTTNNLSSNQNSDNYHNMIHSDILPITRKYKCPNEKCISHTDVSKKEAKFFRINNSYKIKIICLACESIF